MSYLTNYKEIDGGYVAFGGNPKRGKITGKCTIKTAAERRNRTLIEAARTMLADSKLPTTFWAKAMNTACYVQNRVLVVKPHNKTPYKLFHGRTPTLSFMRPCECPVTILNTLDHLGKFDGKADEGFFVGYSLNSKAFRVFNSRTRIVEENLHIRFSENTPNAVSSGPDWLFDIDALTRIMNYEPIVAGTQSNGFAGTKAGDNADLKSSHDDGFKPLSDDGFKLSSDDVKKVDKDLRKYSEGIDQEKEDNVNNTNNVNAASTNEVNTVGGKTSIELPFDPNMPTLEDDSIFNDEDDGVEADMNNLDITIQVSPIPTTRIHKDYPLDQVIRDLQLATQARRMSKNLKEHGSMIGSLMYLTSSRPDIMFTVCACARYQVNPKVSHLHAVKRIFSNYAGASLDRKYTTGEAEYVAASSCCRQVLWIQNQLLDYSMVAFLSKPAKSEELEQIVNFLNAHPIKHALTVNPTIYMSCIEQFWAIVKAKTVNREVQLQALVDGKKIIITESTVKRDLQMEDAEGVDCLPNAT
ncbi:retrovirus-related pol polyprotein from transposon TNT 1-94 [Tanacetum coccineum]